jgi:hypothetical protein
VRAFDECHVRVYESLVRDAIGPASTARHCGQMTLSRSSTTRVPMTETMIEPIHPRPLEKKTNTVPRYPVPANRSLRGETSTGIERRRSYRAA